MKPIKGSHKLTLLAAGKIQHDLIEIRTFMISKNNSLQAA